MQYDFDALKDKAHELRAHLLALVPGQDGNCEQIADEIMKKSLFLTPPEKREMTTQFVVIGSIGEGGRSYKPGNISLDWKNLVELSASLPLLAGSVAKAQPWAYFCIGLGLVMRLVRMADKELGDAEASVMYALWLGRGQDGRISEEAGYKNANAVRKAAGQPPLSRDDFETAINKLLKIRCIGMENGIILLRERVIIHYN